MSESVELFELARNIGTGLLARGEQIALAESCTGGLVAKLLTDVAGSSAWFERGLVTYTNVAKHELLGVPMSVFETAGAVSEVCVRAMAEGVIAHSHAHWAVAITGIAGPAGGSPDKPVGTVWIAWTRRSGATDSLRFHFDGDRESVRTQSAEAAMTGLLDRIADGN